MKVGVLGGGLTGLTVSTNLKHPNEVLEKNPECGGLCRTLIEEGFTFDWGGAHILYSRDKKTLGYAVGLLGKNKVRGRRNNKIIFKGRYVKYPFENGLYDLPKQDNFDCLYYYINNKEREPTNFREWIYHTFGKGIAEKYMIPYNEKIWNMKPEQMDLFWVKGRVPKPPLKSIIRSALGLNTEGYTHQLYFYYPKTGGIQSLITALEKKTPAVKRSFEVKKAVKRKDKWVISDGKTRREYDKIVSTIPLFDLINALDDVPSKVVKAVGKLKYNSLITVMVGLDTPQLDGYTAIYIPDKKIPFHRVAFPKDFSAGNAPKGKSSAIAEITANEGDSVWEKKDGEIADEVIEDLSAMDIIDHEKVCYTRVMRSKYAYVIYDLKYQKNIKTVKEFMEDVGIELCGRFSEYKYLNMDQCIKNGVRMAEKINAQRK